jgi:hypothetical protein
VTGKPNMSFYANGHSRKERRVEWEEEKISIGEEGQPDGFVEVSDMARNAWRKNVVTIWWGRFLDARR